LVLRYCPTFRRPSDEFFFPKPIALARQNGKPKFPLFRFWAERIGLLGATAPLAHLLEKKLLRLFSCRALSVGGKARAS
jgi:hypothetical protein